MTDGHRRGNEGVTVAIVNPSSGGAISAEKLRTAFEELGRRVEWRETSEADPGAGQVANAVASGATTVVACGGDGTVRACLAPLAGTDTVLGVVALGTGNLLAANLGLPSGLDGVGVAVTGPVRRIDLGEVNGESFAVMAGSGLDALMIRDASATRPSGASAASPTSRRRCATCRRASCRPRSRSTARPYSAAARRWSSSATAAPSPAIGPSSCGLSALKIHAWGLPGSPRVKTRV